MALCFLKPEREVIGNSLQYPWLESSLDRGAWLATVRGAAKSQTRWSMQANQKDLFLKKLQIIGICANTVCGAASLLETLRASAAGPRV